jgi:DNA-binding NarL/FixJ family response regulator
VTWNGLAVAVETRVALVRVGGAAMETTIRVLVVDDDPQFRQLLTLLLRQHHDLEVVAAVASGEEGIALSEELAPDVVLLDLRMPGIDGFEALPRIRAVRPAAAVIVLTALEAGEAAQEGILVGAAGFVEKRHVTDRLEPTIRGLAGA